MVCCSGFLNELVMLIGLRGVGLKRLRARRLGRMERLRGVPGMFTLGTRENGKSLEIHLTTCLNVVMVKSLDGLSSGGSWVYYYPEELWE